jgi:quinoprotein glucose dehydrogenase
MRITRHVLVVTGLLAHGCSRDTGSSAATITASAVSMNDWVTSTSDPAGSRFSQLRDISRTNVESLTVAWTYHTGDAPASRSEMQATPIVVDGIMYTTTPALAVVALRADSGTVRWRFDPFLNRARETHANRGVVFWRDGRESRILFTAGRRLYALDAERGTPVPTFGDSGWVDLGAGLGREIGPAYIVATSPGVIYKDLLIQGTRVGEGEGAAPGHVRAYDVRTGAIRWTFRTIPEPGEPGHETWPPGATERTGGANAWAGMSVDVARGLVYVPTGSATPDFYGGDRTGAGLYANSLLALDAATGTRRWHFQTVHHDLWDRDLPASPNLVRVLHRGQTIDAVAQITKSGFVFLFDRVTGVPLFPVEERAVPGSDLPGEVAWPTQPVPTKPAPFARQIMGEGDLTTLTPAAHAHALARFRRLRVGPLFTPPSREGTVILPGFDGGGEWGGAAVDPTSAVLYVSASDVPWIAAMRPTAPPTTQTGAPRSGASVFAAQCAGCHKLNRAGDGDRVPSLLGLATRRSSDEVRAVIERGKGFMPSFGVLPEVEKQALVAYLLGLPAPSQPANQSSHSAELAASRTMPRRARFELVDYERWRTPDGYPAIKPPWGTLSAIDLNTGEYKWRVPLGEFAALTARGVAPTGTELYGGPIVTAAGLVFIAATQDNTIRAFDASSGALLWRAPLPAAGYATPSTYRVNGKQYLVIACGGGKLGSPSGDAYVAFALPTQRVR